jgi:CubicO group peptidase (beta-lactamase class C family)
MIVALSILTLSGRIGLASGPTDIPAEKIDGIFSRWDRTNSPGMVLAVIRDGRIIYQRGYGMASLEQDVPISPETVFYIASTSKQFTAACMALLARQGKVSLDDDVRKYIRELPDYGAKMTIRHLIHHTSGLRDYLSVNSLSGRPTAGITNKDAVRLIARQKELNAPPGEEYSYTNSGYVLLSAIIERVSGKPLRQFADEVIFRPLSMTHSVFRDDRGMVIKRRAAGHTPAPGGFRTADPDNETTGSGNLWTTVGDLSLWDRNFYDNRLGEGLVDQLLTPGRLNSGHPLTYAYGLEIDSYRGLKRVQHGGAFLGFRSEMMRFPEKRLTVICLSNLGSIDPGVLAERVADLFLAGSFPAQTVAAVPTVEVSPEALAAFAGPYRDPRDGGLWTFIVDGASLSLERSGLPRVPLRQSDPKTFRDENGQMKIICTFLPRRDGGPRQVRIEIAGGTVRTFDAIKPVSPTMREMEDYVGLYHSPEAEATFTFVTDNGQLQIERPRQPRQALLAGMRDEFIGNPGTVQFERDASGRVTGFRFNLPRARKVRFDRQSDRH